MKDQAKQLATIALAVGAAHLAERGEVTAPADATPEEKQNSPSSVAYTGDARRVTVEEPEVSVRPRYERFQDEDGTFVCIDNSTNRIVSDSLCNLSDEIWIA